MGDKARPVRRSGRRQARNLSEQRCVGSDLCSGVHFDLRLFSKRTGATFSANLMSWAVAKGSNNNFISRFAQQIVSPHNHGVKESIASQSWCQGIDPEV
ncbi:hypothetical protein PoB_003668500 [Plakobranchus ocellatus]|uniref:Uncharacterized protein n=1 Tax=Plakobranchus ocellatus TaxID=259542 RepID=A0AAV4APJ2_9GAST|nr:hypothetical protein PoB_003668500 [Plakobranchus ocellatus]